MRKGIYILLMVLLAAVLLYSVIQILNITTEYRAGEDSYEELEEFFVLPETLPPEALSTEYSGEGETVPADSTEPPLVWPEVDFESLAQINSDVVAWIYVPDTKINYPVVQGKDNEYYLNHLFTKKVNSSGSIFLDCGAEGDFSDRNSVLHGHHMKNGSMFAGICNYKDASFYEDHPTGMLLTPHGNYEIRFFSGYVCGNDADAWQAGFTDGEYAEWLDQCIRRSYFEADVAPSIEDRIITLSTCSYEYNNARFVLHGVLVRAE